MGWRDEQAEMHRRIDELVAKGEDEVRREETETARASITDLFGVLRSSSKSLEQAQQLQGLSEGEPVTAVLTRQGHKQVTLHLTGIGFSWYVIVMPNSGCPYIPIGFLDSKNREQVAPLGSTSGRQSVVLPLLDGRLPIEVMCVAFPVGGFIFPPHTTISKSVELLHENAARVYVKRLQSGD